MKRRDPAEMGRLAFERHYRSLFQTENEWQRFLHNLVSEHKPALRFAPQDEGRLRNLWQQHQLPWQTTTIYPNALVWPEAIPLHTSLPGSAEKLLYPMNVSSFYPVVALAVQPGDTILDACAAPGGKTLVIADLLQRHGALIANDSSAARNKRLRQTLREYGHDEVTVWQRPAETVFKRYRNHFDKILLDAPCSSEKHLYTQPQYLQQWTPARMKHLQQRQIALLNGLWLALKVGGRLVYSTCAANRTENEEVVADFLRRQPEARLISKQRIWPDAATHDPMFIATFASGTTAA